MGTREFPRVAFSLGLLFLFWPDSYAADDGSTKQTPVAEVFGKEIFADQLEPKPEEQKQKKSELNEEQYKEWLGQYRKNRLSSFIWHPLIDAYVKKHRLDPTEEEITSYIAWSDQSKIRNREAWKARRQKLIEELKSPELTETRRSRMTNELEVLEKVIASDQQQAKLFADEKMQEMQRKSLHKVAADQVRQWKFNKALYKEYGGKVIFQQFGSEPLDAYEKFLAKHEANKDFQIWDLDLRARFYGYFRMRHTEVPVRLAKFYFEKPYWLGTKEEMEAAGRDSSR